MKVLLINADCQFNLAIRKLYTWHLSAGDEIEMRNLRLTGYPSRKKIINVNADGFDKVYCSNVFEQNAYAVDIIGCDNIEYGGIGSRNPQNKLPTEVENTEPYYFPTEKTTHAFITRGCINKCYFCKVPKHEGGLYLYRPVEQTVRGIRGEFVEYMDNNILAYNKHKEVLQWLVGNKIHCEFNQGLDFRKVDDENLSLLAKMRYGKFYTFAFDDIGYKPLLDEKIKLIKKYIPQEWKIRFFIYFNPQMDFSDLIKRVEWCREHKCVPYVMRDSSCWEMDADLKNLLTDYTAYCNQISFFKKMSFYEFIGRYENDKRITSQRADKETTLYFEYERKAKNE